MVILTLITGFSSFAITLDSINIGHHGKYVWRGLNFNNRPVNQGDVSFSYGNFSLSTWWNYDVSKRDIDSGEGNQFTEVDYTISYSTEINGFGLEGGFIYYDFPNVDKGEDNETREFYISISFPYAFNPSVTIYQDINESRGLYYSLGINEDFQIKFKDHLIPVSLSANIGFNSERNWVYYYGGGSTNGGISNVDITLSSSYDLSDEMVIEPYVSFSALLNGAQNLDPANLENQAVNIWVGVNLSINF